MPYIPGSPIEAYCMNCKNDTNHVVLEAEGTQIRSARCEKCNTEGPFRSPRAKTKAALMEFATKKKTKKKTTATKTRRSRKPPPPSPEVVYQQLMEDMDMSTAVKYSAKKDLEEGELINHPTFGYGIVTSRTDVQKVKVFFESGERVMICNRK
ncbi:MAG: hypothetical protein GY854_29560 [Deltaproteobacteria bacterium]|nr:hypothetical protein [Deltaproteobacteria bacterium]